MFDVATKTDLKNKRLSQQTVSDTYKNSSKSITSPIEKQNFSVVKSKGIKQGDLILFTTQLAVMLDSGVVLSEALDTIADSTSTGKQAALAQIIYQVADTVKNGEPFSKALATYPKVFNLMFISMVKASEASGKMVEMLNILSGYLSFEFETRKKIKGALTYPIIMVVMSIIATCVMMLFVLPKFIRIYESKGSSLPMITQVLVNFSKMLSNLHVMAIVSTVATIGLMGFYYWARTNTGRKVIDYVKIRMPVIGTMFIDLVITRSMRIMSTMINTGVNLLDSIKIVQNSCDNYFFQKLWADTADRIQDGHQLSESLSIADGQTTATSQNNQATLVNTSKQFGQLRLIAPGIVQMLRAGEKSGKLGYVSDKVSLFYEKKLEASIKIATTLIEPLMVAVLGAIIGTVAIAMLLPVFKISSIITH
ncbi:type II secretion system F family protein [Planctomycetota bacterium]